MSRLQNIENALININDAVFQELCDSFLTLRNDNYKAYSRIGSQAGKQKTIKGTPDAFLLLPNGKYIFVEYSTNISKGLSKLKEDIKKCLDFKKTNISIEKIDEIIICINYNLDINYINELNNLLSETYITLSLYSLDSLALELNLNHRNLVHEYLGLHFDTGQIVSINTFINENNKAKGIGTPLNNPFLHRKNELKDFLNLLYENDIVILQGAPGVGKTKLAIETMNEFLRKNSEYNAFCISNKNSDLLEDLYQYFDLAKSYILFVDDANRIDTFGQILGFYKIQRAGKFKIIITVRDYAFIMVRNMCQDFLHEIYKINKLTDDQIIDIISEEPFGILNSRYHKEIVRISEGNPRLAIMAALLAKEKQNIHALSDVSDLFENYFSRFNKDNEELENPVNIKILGIIAFFYAIPFKDKELTISILQNFDLNYNDFINKIDTLDKLEIVNIQYEYVKIPEQNIATFYFYKAFIKDNLLSFQTLIEKYFDKNTEHFKDCIIPANNTFGYQKVIEKLQPILRNYWISIRDNKDKAFKFLSLFWFYLQNETLEFINNIIMLLPLSNNSYYKLKDEKSNFSYNRNEILGLLENFYHTENSLENALELSFEYVRKIPSNFTELIYNIKKSLIFDIDDEYYGFIRQSILFKILIKGLNNKDILFTSSFCELSNTFLHFKYHHTEGGRHNTITFYNYPLPNNSYIRDFRRIIWESIDNNFSDNMIEILQKYSESRSDIIKELMEHDIQYLVNIIKKHLTSDKLEHCKYVQEQMYWCKKLNINNPDFSVLYSNFRNHLYEMYLIINWNKYRDKENFDYNDFHEYERLKETEIRNAFIFYSIEEARIFYNDFLYLYKAEKNENKWNYNKSLDLIIDENIKRNFELGCQFLLEVISNNLCNFFPDIVFRNNLNTENKANYIWNLLQSIDFKYKPTWELMFFENLSDQLLTEKQITLIKNSISKIDYYCNLYFDKLQKFEIFNKNIFEEIIRTIVNSNEASAKIYLWIDVFDKYFERLGEDINLIKRAYLQQVLFGNQFDYDKNGFLKILDRDKHFLFEYVNILYKKNYDRYYLDDDPELNIVWKVDNIETILKNVFDITCEDEIHYGILSDFCNSFFYNLKEDVKERAKNFLINYCKENYNNPDRINLIVNIVQHTMNEHYNNFVLYFISLTQDKELFSKISWRNNEKVYSGDVIFGDIEASEWKNILSIIEKSILGIKLIPIKQYINSKIETALRIADSERKRKYLED